MIARSLNALRPFAACCAGVAVAACVKVSAGGRPEDTAPESHRDTQVIALATVADSAPDRWWALTNIFFAPAGDTLRRRARLPDNAIAVEFAEVVEGDGLTSISAIRFTTTGSDERFYVVDTAGTLDFAHGRVLAFQRRSAVRVADVELTVRNAAGRGQRLPYQVLLSDDGYSYARIAEYRIGHATVDAHDYALKVRAASRNEPFYGIGPGTRIFVDLDGDGQIAEQATVTAGGRPAAAEEVMPGAPFMLGGRAFEFVSIDSAGTQLVMRASQSRVAAVEGFRAPDLAGDALSGQRYRLPSVPGKVTLIEFWSTECGFSEKVRPAANALASSLQGQPFQWVAVTREHDRGVVTKHLGEHPVSGLVVLPDSATWTTYNPTGVTPLFVIVDKEGVVRYRAMGASAIDAVAAKVRSLIEP